MHEGDEAGGKRRDNAGLRDFVDEALRGRRDEESAVCGDGQRGLRGAGERGDERVDAGGA